MLIDTQAKGVELLYRSLPYPEQIKNIDFSKTSSIRFTWRGERYKFDLEYCTIELVKNGMLLGDNASLLMTQCIEFQLKNY